MDFISIIFTVLMIIIIFWYIQYRECAKHLNKIPGPTPLPIIGNVLYFSTTRDVLYSPLKLHQKYGPVFKVSVGFGPLTVSISDPKFLEYLLGSTKLIDKSVDYRFLHSWLGSGLLTSTGAKWKKHRKILTPAFHFQILEHFSDTFDQYSNILVDKLKSEVGKNSTDIYPYVTLCSLDIICGTSMGTSVNAQEDSESEYVWSVKQMCRILITRGSDIFKMFDPLYFFTEDYRIEKKAVEILHNNTYSVIRLREKELKSQSETVEFNEDSKPKKKTLLDLLISYKKEHGTITDENIREEVDTFMFEGHDTTASAMTFTLYCLALNSEIQKKVVEELNYVFEGNFDRPATYQDLQGMKYLEMVIKESLRLYPSVPMYARRVAEDVEYDGGILPTGLTLIINSFAIHRDPKLYPDPERFDPERFSTENSLKRSPYAYVPFSAGSRNCIGQKFAMLEMKEVVSKVLKNFELLPSVPEHKMGLVEETILKSSTGVHIQLKNRVR